MHFLEVNYAKFNMLLWPRVFQSATMGDKTVSDARKSLLSSAESCVNAENSLPRHKFDHILIRNESYNIR